MLMSPLMLQQVILSVERSGTYMVTTLEFAVVCGTAVMRSLVSLKHSFLCEAFVAALERFLVPLGGFLFVLGGPLVLG
jgi:hypothetical protein